MLNTSFVRFSPPVRRIAAQPSLPAQDNRMLANTKKIAGVQLSWAALDRTLDTTTGSQVHAQNEVRPLFNGPDAWPTRLHHVAQASIILIKTYEFINDSVGQDMVNRLRDRARAGCLVVIQYDFKGTAEFPRYTVLRSTPKVLWPLRGEPNVLLIPCYLPRHWQYLALPCCHKKYFITFQPNQPATLLMGGMNIANSYCYGGFASTGPHRVHGYRDTDVCVRGPVVKEAVDDFLRDVSLRAPAAAHNVEDVVRRIEGPRTYAPTHHQAQTRLIISSPLDKQSPRRLPRTFEALLDNVRAGQTVYVSNAFFSPLKSTRKAMIAATQRGVTFVFLNNSHDVHDYFGKFMGFIAHGVMRRLIKACPDNSIRLYEWHSSSTDSLCSIHQKVTVFGDDGPVWIGSANLDTVSADRNHESVMLVQEDGVRKRFQEQFQQDMRRDNVQRISAKTLKRESLWRCLGENLALFVFRNKV